ncbi:MAG: HIT family protein [Candidatus Pacearchaeota archaeon]
MEGCIFCKIVAGEIPCYKVYEDSNYLAFLDINPRNPGHTLVIPKKHYRWVWDVEDIAGYYQVVGKIANAIRKALATDWVVSLVLGEEVPHAHVWLVPRFKNDGHGGSIKLDNIKSISKEEMQEIADKIRKAIE